MKKSLLLISALAVCSLTALAEVTQVVPESMAETGGTSTTTEGSQLLLLPVTSARQIVDGGKYIIAAYNHNWGTAEDNADKRFLKFENNTSKFVTAADATAESVIWTANAIECVCANTTHGYASTVTLSHSNQYLKLPADGTPTSAPTDVSDADACSKIEFTTIAAPSGAAAENSYLNMHFKFSDTDGRFLKSMAVSKNGVLNRNSLRNNAELNNICNSDATYAYTTYFLVWHVIETEDDLAKHAEGYKAERLADPTIGEGLGHFSIQFPAEFDEMIAKKGSETAVSQANLDAYTTAAGNVHATLNMPKEGTYLKFNGANAGDVHAKAVLFYNTQHGTGSGSDKMNLDNTHPDAGYSDAKAILYFNEDHLLSYSAGYYLGLDGRGWLAFKSESDMAADGNGNKPATIGIAPGSPTNSATYQINFDTGSELKGLHINGNNSDYWYGDRCDGVATLTSTRKDHNTHDWIVTQVEELPVTLAEDGYGSFFAPVAVSFGEDVTVYAATVGAENITFTVVEPNTTIAPCTPVLLKGTADITVNATIHYDYAPAVTPALQAESTGNISFFGKSAVEKLTATDGVYTFRLTSGAADVITMTKVEAGTCLPVNTMLVSLPNDCPLIKSDGTVALSLQQPNSTTGLREIGIEEGAAEAIYDLQGRRLVAPVRGINIINGRKVLVK